MKGFKDMKYSTLIIILLLLAISSGCAKTKCVSTALIYENRMNLYGQYYTTSSYVCMKYETSYGF